MNIATRLPRATFRTFEEPQEALREVARRLMRAPVPFDLVTNNRDILSFQVSEAGAFELITPWTGDVYEGSVTTLITLARYIYRDVTPDLDAIFSVCEHAKGFVKTEPAEWEFLISADGLYPDTTEMEICPDCELIHNQTRPLVAPFIEDGTLRGDHKFAGLPVVVKDGGVWVDLFERLTLLDDLAHLA